jgi:hypothetical protein
MPKGGKREGAGRKPGAPNKLTAVRAHDAAREVARSGKPSPADNLRIIANRAMNMAAFYQPQITTKDGQSVINKNFKEELYAYWLAQAREANAKAAPYYTPTLRSVLFAGSVTTTDSQNKLADPRQELVEAYIAMRNGDRRVHPPA